LLVSGDIPPLPIMVVPEWGLAYRLRNETLEHQAIDPDQAASAPEAIVFVKDGWAVCNPDASAQELAEQRIARAYLLGAGAGMRRRQLRAAG